MNGNACYFYPLGNLPLQPNQARMAIFPQRLPPPPPEFTSYVLPSNFTANPPPVGRPIVGGNGGSNDAGYPWHQPWVPSPYLVQMPRDPPPQPQRQYERRSAAAMPNIGPGRECRFCKNNNESSRQYKNHILRNPATNQLVCPVLREHVCEECGATGDDAHTKNYCPKLKYQHRQALPAPHHE